MKNLLSILLLLCSQLSFGQQINGVVTAADTPIALPNASLYNTANRMVAMCDDSGTFTIGAATGDLIEVHMAGYADTSFRVRSLSEQVHVRMKRSSVQLSEVTVRGMTSYQKDSAARHDQYGKELDRRPTKPQFVMNGGVGANGLISSVAEKMSKKYKRNKAFRATFEADEQQRYIDTKYTRQLVHDLTGLTGDDIPPFMNAYPMSYDFARAASDLEIKMWIRSNFKSYKK